MTLDEKITQLMMVAVWPTRDSSYIKEISRLVSDLKIGGLIFMKGSPYRQASQTNLYQSKAKIPLLISIDGEWGLSMRVDSTPSFPRQMMLGAANNLDLTHDLGQEIAKQCKRIGVHLNFAPDIDINNNMANPVINDRSFGENKFIVARHGTAYTKGMQEQHIMACAKHFPGHGDTESDSHYSLPIITGSRKRLDSLELYPFRELIKADVTSIMSAHLFVPALDSTPNQASSISPKVVNKLLKEEMGFEGIVVTDALNMKGVSSFYGPGETALRALIAGNDMLLFVEDVASSLEQIKSCVYCGSLAVEQINESCRKILLAKHWVGLNNYKPVNMNNLTSDLNCCSADMMIRKIVKKGIVVARNQDKVIPLLYPETNKIASVAVGNNGQNDFQDMLNNYIRCDYFSIDKNESKSKFDSLFNALQYYNFLIVSLHGTSRFVNKKLGLTQTQIEFVNRLLVSKKCILVVNGNPYILQHFTNARNVIVSFEDLPVNNQYAAQIIGGGVGSKGQLPVSVTSQFPFGTKIETDRTARFEYVHPEEAKIEINALAGIDSIVMDAIRQKAMPGCQVLVAKEGKVFFQKSFGSLVYDSLIPVRNNSLYDLASLTKVMGTTLAIMKLYEEDKIDLNDKLSHYLNFLKNSNKEKVTIKDVLLHQAGLQAFIPFYKKTMQNGVPDSTIYSPIKDSIFTIQLAANLFMNKNYEDKFWEEIASSELKKSGEYLYSDLGFMMLKKVVEVVSNTDFENYLYQNIYKPLNLSSMVFNPLLSFNINMIAPTENDTLWRKQVVRGYVHDQSAAMQGGVSGNAGLFSNANDVAIIMQMLLNKGIYGESRIFKASTVDLFTKKNNKKSRRGLGFDKPETNKNKISPTSLLCSDETFGHTGFTGTCTWADPEHDLVYVFLSNRVYPSAENKKLAETNVRTRIQDLIYELIKIK